MLLDPFGRTINYLRISLTDRCNYRCVYCMTDKGVELKPYEQILRYEEIEEIVRISAGMGINKIRLTGGEPLVKKNIVSLVAKISALEGISEVTMTTNASLLTYELAEALKKAGLSRINISLDTLDKEKFYALTGGGNLDDVVAGIFAAKKAGLEPIKINMVIFKDTTREERDLLTQFCQKHGLQLQTIKHFNLYDTKNPDGSLSADRPPKCNECNRLRITADGYIKPCLFSNDDILIDLHDIASSINKAVQMKPENGRTCRNRIMRQIGG